MKFIKNNMKFFVINIVIVALFSSFSIYATYTYYSKDISYKKSDGTIVSVESALNELYQSNKSQANLRNELSIKESAEETIAWNDTNSKTIKIRYQVEKDCNYVCFGYASNVSYLTSCSLSTSGNNSIIYGNGVKMSTGTATKGEILEIQVSGSTSKSYHTLFAYILTDE